MVDQNTINISEKSHMEVYNAIRERYFTDLPVHKEIAIKNLMEIILVENCMITFVSKCIRHEVMYAFVTECLIKDSDLKFYLTTASPQMISEYCRSQNYVKNEGDERCLFIPFDMYELFIDRLQLDILTHSTLSDRNIHLRTSIRCKYVYDTKNLKTYF
jgi:hypothetical protein